MKFDIHNHYNVFKMTIKGDFVLTTNMVFKTDMQMQSVNIISMQTFTLCIKLSLFSCHFFVTSIDTIYILYIYIYIYIYILKTKTSRAKIMSCHFLDYTKCNDIHCGVETETVNSNVSSAEGTRTFLFIVPHQEVIHNVNQI